MCQHYILKSTGTRKNDRCGFFPSIWYSLCEFIQWKWILNKTLIPLLFSKQVNHGQGHSVSKFETKYNVLDSKEQVNDLLCIKLYLFKGHHCRNLNYLRWIGRMKEERRIMSMKHRGKMFSAVMQNSWQWKKWKFNNLLSKAIMGLNHEWF